ncbi:MAG: hypothetical protein H7338_18125 [Candidatus Sericytochromatia bacterium]|nr:hypothetical protein [Candidatus Sericytochromatia bacterium]
MPLPISRPMRRTAGILAGLILLAGTWMLIQPVIRPRSPQPDVVLLYAEKERDKAPEFARTPVREFALEGFQNPGLTAKTVVLGGHSIPPVYVGQPAAVVAKAIASFKPDVVVLETCYGASTPILRALADTGLRAWVVAAPYQLPVRDLHYTPAFFTAADVRTRVMAVDTVPPYPMLRWRLDPVVLTAIESQVAAMGPDELTQRLKRVMPALVRMPLPTILSPKGLILIPVASERFKRRP